MKGRRKKKKDKPNIISQVKEGRIQNREKEFTENQVKKKPPDKASGKAMKKLVSRLYEKIIYASVSNKKGIKLCDGNNSNTEMPSRLFKCVDALMVMLRELCLLEEKLDLWLLEGRHPHMEEIKNAKESKQR
jgi:hypothetical protein